MFTASLKERTALERLTLCLHLLLHVFAALERLLSASLVSSKSVESAQEGSQLYFQRLEILTEKV